MAFLRIVLICISLFTYTACGNVADSSDLKAEDGFESSAVHEVELSNAANLRYLSNNILEVASRVPSGTRLQISNTAAPMFYDFRDSDGSVKKSTNGFLPTVKILSVPSSASSNFPPEVIQRLNNMGLYASSTDVNSGTENGEVIPALSQDGTPSSDYLNFFSSNGKRHRNPYADSLKKRFGAQWNRAIPLSSMSPQEQAKWVAIYREMATILDRSRPSARRNLFIDSGSSSQDIELAKKHSISFENSGEIQTYGAWNIAVQGTAPRHGFPNVPCAEFMSEVIRQSYTRAGYRMGDDFKGSNYLLWSNTAAVVNLAKALHASGWIPWDPAIYKPKAGAVAMNATANTPGHAYAVAGANGRFLVDNGSPKGRDLYKTSGKIIGMMFDMGVFFLPPGIIPDRW